MEALLATNPSRARSRAFTLVELMVSMGVLTVLVLMLTSAFNAATRAWSLGEASIERQRSARSVADFIGAELQGALLPVEAGSVSTEGNLQMLINPDVSGMGAYQNSDAIFWQAPLATETSYGDIAVIGYFVRWDQSSGTPRPILCRFFVNPSIRLENGIVAQNPKFLVYASGTSKWLTSSLVDEIAPADKASGYAGLFAENVVGLWVQAYGLDGTELQERFDSRVGYSNQFQMGDRSWSERRFLPAMVKVSLAQIDSKHVDQLAPVWEHIRDLTRESGTKNAAEFLEELKKDAKTNPALLPLLPGIRIYSTDVYLENGR